MKDQTDFYLYIYESCHPDAVERCTGYLKWLRKQSYEFKENTSLDMEASYLESEFEIKSEFEIFKFSNSDEVIEVWHKGEKSGKNYLDCAFFLLDEPPVHADENGIVDERRLNELTVEEEENKEPSEMNFDTLFEALDKMLMEGRTGADHLLIFSNEERTELSFRLSDKGFSPMMRQVALKHPSLSSIMNEFLLQSNYR